MLRRIKLFWAYVSKIVVGEGWYNGIVVGEGLYLEFKAVMVLPTITQNYGNYH